MMMRGSSKRLSSLPTRRLERGKMATWGFLGMPLFATRCLCLPLNFSTLWITYARAISTTRRSHLIEFHAKPRVHSTSSWNRSTPSTIAITAWIIIMSWRAFLHKGSLMNGSMKAHQLAFSPCDAVCASSSVMSCWEGHTSKGRHAQEFDEMG